MKNGKESTVSLEEELAGLVKPNLMSEEVWAEMKREVLLNAEKLSKGWEKEVTVDTNLLIKGNLLQDTGLIPEEAISDDRVYCAIDFLWKHLAWYLRKHSKMSLARAA